MTKKIQTILNEKQSYAIEHIVVLRKMAYADKCRTPNGRINIL